MVYLLNDVEYVTLPTLWFIIILCARIVNYNCFPCLNQERLTLSHLS